MFEPTLQIAKVLRMVKKEGFLLCLQGSINGHNWVDLGLPSGLERSRPRAYGSPGFRLK